MTKETRHIARLRIGAAGLAAIIAAMAISGGPFAASAQNEIAQNRATLPAESISLGVGAPALSSDQRNEAMSIADHARATCRKQAGNDEIAYSVCVADKRGMAYRDQVVHHNQR
ncbi:MAG: hypothetical protein AAGD40_11925 [Pseudomonadota bacterium]